jgi:hypothetical protein
MQHSEEVFQHFIKQDTCAIPLTLRWYLVKTRTAKYPENSPWIKIIITIIIRPCSRVLLEKLTVTQLVKKFPAFYETRRFITVLIRTRHWSLPWARWIQFTASPPPFP